MLETALARTRVTEEEHVVCDTIWCVQSCLFQRQWFSGEWDDQLCDHYAVDGCFHAAANRDLRKRALKRSRAYSSCCRQRDNERKERLEILSRRGHRFLLSLIPWARKRASAWERRGCRHLHNRHISVITSDSLFIQSIRRSVSTLRIEKAWDTLCNSYRGNIHRPHRVLPERRMRSPNGRGDSNSNKKK